MIDYFNNINLFSLMFTKIPFYEKNSGGLKAQSHNIYYDSLA